MTSESQEAVAAPETTTAREQAAWSAANGGRHHCGVCGCNPCACDPQHLKAIVADFVHWVTHNEFSDPERMLQCAEWFNLCAVAGLAMQKAGSEFDAETQAAAGSKESLPTELPDTSTVDILARLGRKAASEPHTRTGELFRLAKGEIERLRADNRLLALHLHGITPDANTQSAPDVEATERAIEEAAKRALS